MLAQAAARPGAVALRLDDRAWLRRVDRVLCTAAWDRPHGALDALGDALDALHASLPEASGDEGPVALLWATYDACWHGAAPRPVHDDRPPGDRCPAVFLATLVPEHEVPVEPSPPRNAAPTWDLGDDARLRHAAMVSAVREGIRDGDVYLVNASLRAHCDGVDDGWMASRVAASEAPRAMLARTADVTVAAMSMECALRWDRRAGVALSRPIKGTRARREDPGADAAEAAALAADPKERAENAMAVDVHRNDLGRVARAGGVTVPALCSVERHRFVHHLVSTVRAEVDPKLPARAMLSSMLPVGSVTGAPKLAAMETLARLEADRRGLYTGVYGVVMADGTVDLSVAIRTVVRDAAGAHYGVGGGIVWDSDPAREWDEVGWKLRGVR